MVEGNVGFITDENLVGKHIEQADHSKKSRKIKITPKSFSNMMKKIFDMRAMKQKFFSKIYDEDVLEAEKKILSEQKDSLESMSENEDISMADAVAIDKILTSIEKRIVIIDKKLDRVNVIAEPKKAKMPTSTIIRLKNGIKRKRNIGNEGEKMTEIPIDEFLSDDGAPITFEPLDENKILDGFRNVADPVPAKDEDSLDSNDSVAPITSSTPSASFDIPDFLFKPIKDPALSTDSAIQKKSTPKNDVFTFGPPVVKSDSSNNGSQGKNEDSLDSNDSVAPITSSTPSASFDIPDFLFKPIKDPALSTDSAIQKESTPKNDVFTFGPPVVKSASTNNGSQGKIDYPFEMKYLSDKEIENLIAMASDEETIEYLQGFLASKKNGTAVEGTVVDNNQPIISPVSDETELSEVQATDSVLGSTTADESIVGDSSDSPVIPVSSIPPFDIDNFFTHAVDNNQPIVSPVSDETELSEVQDTDSVLGSTTADKSIVGDSADSPVIPVSSIPSFDIDKFFTPAVDNNPPIVSPVSDETELSGGQDTDSVLGSTKADESIVGDSNTVSEPSVGEQSVSSNNNSFGSLYFDILVNNVQYLNTIIEQLNKYLELQLSFVIKTYVMQGCSVDNIKGALKDVDGEKIDKIFNAFCRKASSEDEDIPKKL